MLQSCQSTLFVPVPGQIQDILDVRGQGKWPSGKNISGLASPNPHVV